MATAKDTGGVVVATTTFHGPGGLYVPEGSVWRADDPVVRARPHLFRPAVD